MHKKIIFSAVIVLSAIFISSRHSFAYSTTGDVSLTPLPSIINPIEALKNQSNFFKNIVPSIGIGTTMPSLNLLNTENLSASDLPGALKAVAVLAINLFLIVIQVVVGILKALLPFLS